MMWANTSAKVVHCLSPCCPVQMVEELIMATLMSVAFSLPTWYLCQLKGSFFVWWLTYLISLADGIGVNPFLTSTSCHAALTLMQAFYRFNLLQLLS